jgi:hypothetical protein
VQKLPLKRKLSFYERTVRTLLITYGTASKFSSKKEMTDHKTGIE